MIILKVKDILEAQKQHKVFIWHFYNQDGQVVDDEIGKYLENECYLENVEDSDTDERGYPIYWNNTACHLL